MLGETTVGEIFSGETAEELVTTGEGGSADLAGLEIAFRFLKIAASAIHCLAVLFCASVHFSFSESFVQARSNTRLKELSKSPTRPSTASFISICLADCIPGRSNPEDGLISTAAASLTIVLSRDGTAMFPGSMAFEVLSPPTNR